jgi:hypothetical protein
MTERKTDSEPREEDEDLKLEKEKIRDLNVPESESEQVKGGQPKPTRTCGC